MSHFTRKTYLAYRYYQLVARSAYHRGMTDTARLAWSKAVQARRSIYAPALVPAKAA